MGFSPYGPLRKTRTQQAASVSDRITQQAATVRERVTHEFARIDTVPKSEIWNMQSEIPFPPLGPVPPSSATTCRDSRSFGLSAHPYAIVFTPGHIQAPSVSTGVFTQRRSIRQDQPRGVQLEYQLKAINKAGQSEPSNTIAVVL
jgi:hypothetical protein